MNLHTKAVHAGDRKRTGSWVPVTTPIHTATSFFYDDTADLDRSFEGLLTGPTYARYGNPTNEALEEQVAQDIEAGKVSAITVNGDDLTGEPLTARKAALERLLKTTDKNSRIRYTEHIDEDGATVFKHARDMHLEGIISKRKNAPYRSGRSDNFVKIKTHNEQEFIVAGFSPASALLHAVGALTVAVREDGELRYAGRVGTGYTRDIARDLWKRLQPLAALRYRCRGTPFLLPEMKDEHSRELHVGRIPRPGSAPFPSGR